MISHTSPSFFKKMLIFAQYFEVILKMCIFAVILRDDF